MTTIDDVKAYAGITSSNADPILQALLEGSAKAFATYCDRASFFSQTYEDWRDGTGSARLVLANPVVTTVHQVKINGQTILPSVNGSSGYFCAPGGRTLILVGYKFTAGLRNVYVNYDAGYSVSGGQFALPDDLKMAAKMYVSQRFKERERLGVSSKSLAGESVAYGSDQGGSGSGGLGMPSAAAKILMNYRNVVPETGR